MPDAEPRSAPGDPAAPGAPTAAPAAPAPTAAPATHPDQVPLVRAAQRGDALALASLLDLLTPYVGRICGPIALSEAEDAAQEALIIILRGIGGLREPNALFGWARVIAVREAVRIARRAESAVPAPAEELSTLLHARGQGLADPELGVDMRDVLARLSPRDRAVLVLRDLEGVDEQSASRILEVPAGTVRSRLFRARRGFRREWER